MNNKMAGRAALGWAVGALFLGALWAILKGNLEMATIMIAFAIFLVVLEAHLK